MKPYQVKKTDRPEPPVAPDTKWCRPRLAVDIFEAKPNPMFTEAHRALVRFLRYSGDKVKCAECGRKKQTLWTMLCSFQAWDMAALVPKKSGKVHLPLTPVCQAHLLAAEMEEVDKDGNLMPAAEDSK